MRLMSLFFFMTYAKILERDFERLDLCVCYRHMNVSPLGIAEGIHSVFLLNVHRTAMLDGFDAVFANACDMEGLQRTRRSIVCARDSPGRAYPDRHAPLAMVIP